MGCQKDSKVCKIMFEKQIGKEYIYVFVRKDISPEQRLVQACHATVESGILFCNRANYDLLHAHNIIVLSVKNLKELNEAYEKLIPKVSAIMFYEPDIGENTSFSTRPVIEEERILFKDYMSLKFERSFLYYLKIFIRHIRGELFDG